MSTLHFGVCESVVRSPFLSVSYTPEKPFSLGGEDGNDTPWADWRCDRFHAFIPLDASPRRSMTEDEAIELAQHHQGSHSFDGSLAFLPASHAEDFFQHLEAFVRTGLSGIGIPAEDRFEKELSIGDYEEDVVAYWGTTTPDGLFLLFSSSADAFDEDWLESAWRRYPRRDEIALPAEATVFDPAFAFFHADAHLADHLTPDRLADHGNPDRSTPVALYQSFLSWAQDKGYLKSTD